MYIYFFFLRILCVLKHRRLYTQRRVNRKASFIIVEGITQTINHRWTFLVIKLGFFRSLVNTVLTLSLIKQIAICTVE